MYRVAALGFLIYALSCAVNSSMQAVTNNERVSIDDRPLDLSRRSIEPLPPLNSPRLVMTKRERKLDVFDGDRPVKTYRISLGFSPVGDKEQEGDGKTPEGEFYVFAKNPKSKFYLSLGISYPSIEDAERGLRHGLISRPEHDEIVDAVKQKKMPLQNTKLGGEIYLHGGGAGGRDWTWGCAALANDDIKEIFHAIPVGTKVLILP